MSIDGQLLDFKRASHGKRCLSCSAAVFSFNDVGELMHTDGS